MTKPKKNFSFADHAPKFDSHIRSSIPEYAALIRDCVGLSVRYVQSDTTVLDSVITTHGLSWGHDRIFAASANHSVWFHRQVDFNDYVLYSTSSPVAADSRGLGTGHFFDRSGKIVATVVQEGVLIYFPSS